MKSDRLIIDLLKIAEIDGVSRSNGVEARKKALMSWLKDWVIELNIEQSVLDKQFTAEEEDFLKEYMVRRVTDDLLENCVYLDRQKTKIKLKLFALRREL